MMKISELGEFGLIDRLDKMITAAKTGRFSKNLVIGIGDDTAAWKNSGKIQLATVDSMTEGVHFTRETTTWQETGRKALAINLSDIAAMGGIPRYALINLSLPPDTEVEHILLLYEGIISLANETKTAITGGNISGGRQVAITVTAVGESKGRKILRRDKAKAGDVIAVTGRPGSAAGGLAMLTQNMDITGEDATYFRNAWLDPAPRLKEGQTLARNGIKSAIDTSDGLLADLKHICEASKVSAVIDTAKMPVHDLLKKYFKDKATEMALTGGEDYELLFTGRRETVEKVIPKLGIPANIIGEIRGGEAGKIEVSGADLPPDKTGWTHF